MCKLLRKYGGCESLGMSSWLACLFVVMQHAHIDLLLVVAGLVLCHFDEQLQHLQYVAFVNKFLQTNFQKHEAENIDLESESKRI